MADTGTQHNQVTNENRFIHVGDEVSFFCNETTGFIFSSVSGFAVHGNALTHSLSS
jgi:hypothetical protein